MTKLTQAVFPLVLYELVRLHKLPQLRIGPPKSAGRYAQGVGRVAHGGDALDRPASALSARERVTLRDGARLQHAEEEAAAPGRRAELPHRPLRAAAQTHRVLLVHACAPEARPRDLEDERGSRGTEDVTDAHARAVDAGDGELLPESLRDSRVALAQLRVVLRALGEQRAVARPLHVPGRVLMKDVIVREAVRADRPALRNALAPEDGVVGGAGVNPLAPGRARWFRGPAPDAHDAEGGRIWGLLLDAPLLHARALRKRRSPPPREP